MPEQTSLWHGTLPPQIGELTHLEYLEIKGSIFGPLPAEIGQLRNLKELRLRLNLGYDRERRIVCEGYGPGGNKRIVLTTAILLMACLLKLGTLKISKSWILTEML